jgi:hypothetical protein
MRIEAELLGCINESLPTTAPLQTKYVLRVTIEQLALWLQYERKGSGKNSPFRISEHSTIRIDPEIQRGKDSQGFLLQNSRKIMEIANTLLSPNNEMVPRLYLGCLTWNVRPQGKKTKDFFEIQKIEIDGKQPRWRLCFDTDAIYLTDSAHRHLGIVESFRQYQLNREKYPTYSPKYEFSVELYTLDKQKEKELFSELNSKQKKISAAKQKEMDVSSPIGALKDAIQDYDRTSRQFFADNIEVSSNQNDKHTLLTMSVFVSSIGEMFSSKEIKQARDDEELRAELSEYYCEFFYQLADSIIVRANLGDGEKEYHPFRNLYNEYIKKAVDNYNTDSPSISEDLLQEARDQATKQNNLLRKIDVANHNSFIKAFSRLGGYIRRMDNWQDVITRLQTRHNISADGKFFQKANLDLFKVMDYGVSIATLNEDDTINIQVQTKTINTIYDYLLDVLQLKRDTVMHMLSDDLGDVVPLNGESEPIKYTQEEESYCVVYGYFFLPSTMNDVNEHSVRLDIDAGEELKSLTKKGKSGGYYATKVEVDRSYIDPEYQDILRWRAVFEIKLPAAKVLKKTASEIEVTLVHPSFENQEKQDKATANFILKQRKDA